LAKVLRILLGPEEEWDDAAAELALELHGIDSSGAKLRLKRLVDKLIREKTERGENILPSLLELQSHLARDLKAP